MRRHIHTIVISLLLSVPTTYASDEVSYGLGIGAMYSGLGMNVGLRSESDFRYLSAGCVALGYSDAEGTIAACGVGAGWLWTDILPAPNNRHGLGVYLGPVGYRGRGYIGDKTDTIYGAGLSYAYFTRGINRNGWALGGTVAVGDSDDDTMHLLLEAGYQY